MSRWSSRRKIAGRELSNAELSPSPLSFPTVRDSETSSMEREQVCAFPGELNGFHTTSLIGAYVICGAVGPTHASDSGDGGFRCRKKPTQFLTAEERVVIAEKVLKTNLVCGFWKT